jgi:putative endonuclease
MYFLYILQPETTGRYYIGSTDSLSRRIKQHNDPAYGGSKTTKRFKGPWELAYFESFATRSEAMAREKQLKSWKSRRALEDLIGSTIVQGFASIGGEYGVFHASDFFIRKEIEVARAFLC